MALHHLSAWTPAPFHSSLPFCSSRYAPNWFSPWSSNLHALAISLFSPNRAAYLLTLPAEKKGPSFYLENTYTHMHRKRFISRIGTIREEMQVAAKISFPIVLRLFSKAKHETYSHSRNHIKPYQFNEKCACGGYNCYIYIASVPQHRLLGRHESISCEHGDPLCFTCSLGLYCGKLYIMSGVHQVKSRY